MNAAGENAVPPTTADEILHVEGESMLRSQLESVTLRVHPQLHWLNPFASQVLWKVYEEIRAKKATGVQPSGLEFLLERPTTAS